MLNSVQDNLVALRPPFSKGTVILNHFQTELGYIFFIGKYPRVLNAVARTAGRDPIVFWTVPKVRKWNEVVPVNLHINQRGVTVGTPTKLVFNYSSFYHRSSKCSVSGHAPSLIALNLSYALKEGT